MKRTLLRGITLFLILAVLTQLCLPALATSTPGDNNIEASYYLSSYSGYVYMPANGNTQVHFSVTGTGVMTEIGALTIVLMESSNGTSWTTKKTFTRSVYTNMMGSNAVTHSATVTFYGGVSGYYYKAYITFWASRNGSGDSRQYVTAVVQK
jgi:hypothetical protein